MRKRLGLHYYLLPQAQHTPSWQCIFLADVAAEGTRDYQTEEKETFQPKAQRCMFTLFLQWELYQTVN